MPWRLLQFSLTAKQVLRGSELGIGDFICDLNDKIYGLIRPIFTMLVPPFTTSRGTSLKWQHQPSSKRHLNHHGEKSHKPVDISHPSHATYSFLSKRDFESILGPSQKTIVDEV